LDFAPHLCIGIKVIRFFYVSYIPNRNNKILISNTILQCYFLYCYSLVMSSIPVIIKFLKFGIVGFTGVFVDFGITFLLKETLKVHKYIANSIGFTLAAITNYLLNRIWTFNSSNPEFISEFLMFFAIALVGLAINNLLVYLLSEMKYKLNFYFAKAFATVVIFIWNFLMNYFLTFN